jgi:hypothetical protein
METQMTFNPYYTLSTSFILICSLTACGGGGGDGANTVVTPPSQPIANVAPSVSAGEDQTVDENTSVTLTGTASDSDGTISSYQWLQTGGTSVSLANADSATATFSTPNISVNETVTFALTVTDNDGASATDSINILVTNIEPENIAPSVSAGGDQTVDENTSVTLTGTASDSDGTISSYQWLQTEGTSVSLTNADSATATFTTPDISVNETATFTLTVTDDKGETSTDSAIITISNVNALPEVSIAGNQSSASFSTVMLTATATDIDGEIDSYQWSQTSGSAVDLNNTTSDTLSFFTPNVSESTDLTFNVMVTDNNGGTASVNHTITITPAKPGIHGQVNYERIPYWRDTIRGNEFGLDPRASFLSAAKLIVVNLNDVDGNMVLQTITDEDGYFYFELDDSEKNKSFGIEAVAQMELDGLIDNGFYVETYESIAPMSILKKQTRSFKADTFLYSDSSQYIDIAVTAGWNETEGKFDEASTYAQSFAVLDTILNAIRFFESMGYVFDNGLEPLKVLWSPEEMYDAKLPGVYENFFNTIDMAAPYSETTVIHEFTHFFEHKVLKRSDTKGGTHFPGNMINLPLAFSEGMAQAVAYAMLDDWQQISAANEAYDSRYALEDFYEVAKGGSGFEAVVTTTDKAGNEYSFPGNANNPPYDELPVMYYLLSLLADRPPTERTSNLYNEIGKEGFAAVLNIMSKSDAVSSLYSFATELKALFPGQVSALNSLEQKLQFVADDKWGSTQTPFEQFVLFAYDNVPLPTETYLPIYKDIASSDTINVCFNGGFAGLNDFRPGTHRYIKFTAPDTGTYSVTAQDAFDKNGDTHTYRIEIQSAGQNVQVLSPIENTYEFSSVGGATYILYAIGENYFEGRYNINETICTDVSLTVK